MNLAANPTEKSELITLSAELQDLEAKYRLQREQSTRRLTIPAIFRRPGDENFLSDYLAYILNPEQNGVGTEPLQAMLSLAYPSELDIELDKAFIHREYQFKKNPGCGRIDFLIELGESAADGVIGIENKIYSTEGTNQTGAYVKGIREDYPGFKHYLIFLTPTGFSPGANEFKPVSYADLSRSLREIRYPVLSDIHKTVIWEDFLYHLEEYIVMTLGKLELSGKARLYLEHHQMLEGLNQEYQATAQKVYDFVTGSIKSFVGEGWHFNMQGRNGFQEVNRESWNLGRCYVFYQYFFARDTLLTNDKFSLMVGVYPINPDSRKFLDWLQVNRPEIKEICARYEMDAYPPKVQGTGALLFAFKNYLVTLDLEDLSKFDRQFIQALEQFWDFKTIMDEAIETYRAML